MSKYICLDTSVLIKTLIEEKDTETALTLLESVLLNQQIIALPQFAWAEAGSVLRKICGRNSLTTQEADELWFEFRQYPGVIYLSDEIIADKAWKISCNLNMPTLYDSSFLAVAEVITEITSEICEYWTADQKLYDSVEGKKSYIRYLKSFDSRKG
ncbi:MAG: PilT domain-containing protein [Desulfotomaculum sp. 46_296]|nr:MAG: PilT domain-containing protein [Desulfotomaculum sp. 46_296]KUK84640.1 MAG: PilT domain-containing protein [Desulfofundulus kuznetsovii]